MRNILITGGTGTWGQEITRQLLLRKDVRKIVIYSRAERSQEEMKFNIQDDRVEYVVGDILDYNQLSKAMIGIDTVFHTAAIKAIPTMEKDCMIGYRTNILGTDNVVKAAISNKIKRFVFVSTDKAVAPINAYGISKAAAEHIIMQASRDNPKMVFRIVRSGNILGSSSSILKKWKKSIQEDNTLTVTDENMTRFYITKEEAVKQLINCIESSCTELSVILSKYARVKTLAQVAIEVWGNDNTKIVTIGNRGNEKIHEQIISIYDGSTADIFSNSLEEYGVDELVDIIRNENI